MCNLYSITTDQEAIRKLFRVVNRYVCNLAPMTGVFPDYPAPVIRDTAAGTEMALMRWGMPPPPRTCGPLVTNIRNTSSPHWRGRATQGSATYSSIFASILLQGRHTNTSTRGFLPIRGSLPVGCMNSPQLVQVPSNIRTEDGDAKPDEIADIGIRVILFINRLIAK